MKKIIINVDDLGLSNAVNQAVVNLAEKKLITATSYMVGGAISNEHKKALKHMNIDIGLHLDFTEIYDSHLTSTLKNTLIKCYTNQFDKQKVAANIKQQFDEFEDEFEHTPIFVDGHQHVHQFPIIRDVLMAEIVKRTQTSHHTISSRVTIPIINDFKSWIIFALGGRRWQSMCHHNNIITNQAFGGVYGFDRNKEELKKLWQQWLTACPNSKGTTSLIMCHPALPATSSKDSDNSSGEIKQAREMEYQWLMSDEFTYMLIENKVNLMSWSQLNSQQTNL